MSCVYFVRHGQSRWNVENKICGRTDIPLTEEGVRQARLTGEKVLSEGIKADAILYSPLLRARDTALAISEMTGIPSCEEPRLIEQNFGRFEGTSPRNSEEFRAAKRQFCNSFSGGESMLQLAHRIYGLLDDIHASGQTCILVAHNGIARIINSYFHEMTNDEFADFGVPNCCVIRYDWPEL